MLFTLMDSVEIATWTAPFLSKSVKLVSMSQAESSRVLNRRVSHFALRLAIAALALILLVYCGLRSYMAYVARRSIDLLKEASLTSIGSTEDSIAPFVNRYHGVKWSPPTSTCDDALDKADCEYKNEHLPEYQYSITASPFDVLSPAESQAGRIHHLLSILMIQTPSAWRDPFALRDWWVDVEISIREGHVVAVNGGLFVEGRNRWLGNTWRLSAEMPHVAMHQKAYVIDGSFLTFPGNGGAGTVQYLTPVATPEQFESAHNFNARCITGLFPCRCLSDLTPLVFEYLDRHPEFGSIVRTDDCPYPGKAP